MYVYRGGVEPLEIVDSCGFCPLVRRPRPVRAGTFCPIIRAEAIDLAISAAYCRARRRAGRPARCLSSARIVRSLDMPQIGASARLPDGREMSPGYHRAARVSRKGWS